MSDSSHQKVFDYSRKKIGDQRMEALIEELQTNRYVCELDLSFNLLSKSSKSIARWLSSNTTVKVLSLRHNQFEDDDANEFAKMLTINTTLISLDLSGFAFRNFESNALGEALCINKTLQTLLLERGMIGSVGLTGIADAFKVNRCLTFISFSNCFLGDVGVTILSKSLRYNSSLVKLGLNAVRMETIGAIELAFCLKENTSIRSIDIGFNSIGLDGHVAIADALKTNNSLTFIDFSMCELSASGSLDVILNALCENKCIRHLCFEYNSINHAGAAKVANLLKCNKSIDTLDLRNCGFGNLGLAAIGHALRVNTTLTGLVIDGNLITPDVYEAFADTIRENYSILSIDRNRWHTIACPAIDKLLARNFEYLWKNQHRVLLDACVALSALRLPAYILLWIYNQFGHREMLIKQFVKIGLIEGVVNSARRIENQRSD